VSARLRSIFSGGRKAAPGPCPDSAAEARKRRTPAVCCRWAQKCL